MKLGVLKIPQSGHVQNQVTNAHKSHLTVSHNSRNKIKSIKKYINATRIVTIALFTECSLNFTECQRKVKTQVQVRPRFASVKVQTPLPWNGTPWHFLTQAWLPSFPVLNFPVPHRKCNCKLKYFGKVLMSQCEGRLVFLPRLGQSSKLIGFITSLEGHKL